MLCRLCSSISGLDGSVGIACSKSKPVVVRSKTNRESGPGCDDLFVTAVIDDSFDAEVVLDMDRSPDFRRMSPSTGDRCGVTEDTEPILWSLAVKFVDDPWGVVNRPSLDLLVAGVKGC